MLSGFALSAPQRTLPQKDAEFDALTVEEKGIVYRDLYGAGNYSIVEDDDMIKTSLNSFEQCLSLSGIISDDDKKHYNVALEKSPKYVTDRDLRLQFLRCELFDPKVRLMLSNLLLLYCRWLGRWFGCMRDKIPFSFFFFFWFFSFYFENYLTQISIFYSLHNIHIYIYIVS